MWWVAETLACPRPACYRRAQPGTVRALDDRIRMPDAAEPTRPDPGLSHRRRDRPETVQALHDPLRTPGVAELTLHCPLLLRRRRAGRGTVRARHGPR